MEELQKHFPYRGPCVFCGYWDARHRLWDAIHSRYKQGESIKSLCKDYDIKAKSIKAIEAFYG
jgi:hypothetical protein